MIRRRGKGRAGPDLESERKIVEYIKSHPKEPYTAIGKRFEYSPSHLSQIARDNGIIHYARWEKAKRRAEQLQSSSASIRHESRGHR
jgi:hypothetical protein